MNASRILPTAITVAALAASALAQCSNYAQTLSNQLLLRADNGLRSVALPFAFPYNGVSYDRITVSSNGWIKLGQGVILDSEPAPDEWSMLGLTSYLIPRIAVCWDDLNASVAPAGVFYAASATRVSVVWQTVPRSGATTTFANCECILDVSGAITLNYDASCTMNLSSASSIVGISKADPSLSTGTHLLDWSAIAPDTPVIDGTGYQLFTAAAGTAPFDLSGGMSISLIPDTGTAAVDDYLATVAPGLLTYCAPSGFPPTTSDSVTIGSRCGLNQPIYESFTTNTGTTSLDLAGSSIKFTRSGATYSTGPGLGFDLSYVAVAGVAYTDNQVIGGRPVGTMGIFPFGSLSYTQVAICANGYVWLGTGTLGDSTPTVPELANSTRIAPLWMDHLPAGTTTTTPPGAGLIHWNTGPDYLGTGLAYAQGTWAGVRERSNAGTNTFQMTLCSNGDIYFAYGAMSGGVTHSSIVGISGGSPWSGLSIASNLVTGGIANALGPVILTGGTGGIFHSVNAAGQLGFDLVLDASITLPSATSGFGMFGIGMSNPNLPLDAIFGPGSAPGCGLYTDAAQNFFYPAPIIAGPFSTTFSVVAYAPVPVLLHVAGIQVFTQAAAVVTGANPAGILTSNGVMFTVGF